MSKAALIEVIKSVGITKQQAESVLTAVNEFISYELATNGKCEFHGLGTFKVLETAARKGRNPQTGEEIDIAAGKRVKFKPAKALKDVVV
jgi:DNA-binding protein HU-beta